MIKIKISHRWHEGNEWTNDNITCLVKGRKICFRMLRQVIISSIMNRTICISFCLDDIYMLKYVSEFSRYKVQSSIADNRHDEPLNWKPTFRFMQFRFGYIFGILNIKRSQFDWILNKISKSERLFLFRDLTFFSALYDVTLFF